MANARAWTSDELTKLRSEGQQSRLYLAIHTPATVFACRVNQTFSTLDDISEITYDGVTTGAYGLVLPGMTVYVGTSAGAYDVGMCRIRKAATATKLYIGRTSEIAWIDHLYLTVVDDFALWAKHWYLPNEDTVYMDTDIAYSSQNAAFDPIVIMGADRVLWLTGATVSITPSASASWVIGSTISSYSWSAPGASATANLTTATPTITYNAPGQYRISCTVTAANGKSATGHRLVFVYSDASMPISDFTLESCTGDAGVGGWSFVVSTRANVASLRDRARVILFARDWYGGTEGSMGLCPGSENIVCSGWLDEETIDFDAMSGAVRFTVRGPQYWLNKLAAFPSGLKNSSGAPTDWMHAQNLTIDMALHNLLHWRSTVDAVLDCILTGDARTASGIMTDPGTIWAQLRNIGTRILANPCFDKCGRLFVEIDPQFVPPAQRAAGNYVAATLTAADWRERIRIPHKVVGDLAMLETGGTNASTFFLSRAYGKVPGRYGAMEQKDNMLVDTQDQLNVLTGLMLAQRNNPWPTIEIALASNNRLVDIAPRHYLSISIAAGDTPRGIVWTNRVFITRRVSYEFDGGFLATDIEVEGETSGPAGLTVVPPTAGGQINFPPIVPVMPEFPDFPPPDTWYPPVTPPALDDCGSGSGYNGPYHAIFDNTTVCAGEKATCYFPATLHPDAGGIRSELRLDIRYYGDSAAHTHVKAIGGGTFSNAGGGVFVLGGVGDQTITGFEVSVDTDGLTATYTPTEAIRSGAFTTSLPVGDPSFTVVIGDLNPDAVYYVRTTGKFYFFRPGDGTSANRMTSSGGASATGTFYATGSGATAEDYHNHYLHPDADGNITLHFDEIQTNDNEGTLPWQVWETRANTDRYIIISDALVYNVCAA